MANRFDPSEETKQSPDRRTMTTVIITAAPAHSSCTHFLIERRIGPSWKSQENVGKKKNETNRRIFSARISWPLSRARAYGFLLSAVSSEREARTPLPLFGLLERYFLFLVRVARKLHRVIY